MFFNDRVEMVLVSLLASVSCKSGVFPVPRLDFSRSMRSMGHFLTKSALKGDTPKYYPLW